MSDAGTAWPAGGYDFSHWNGDIDWGLVASTLPAFVILKATDGMGVDPKFDIYRQAAEDRHLQWLGYPWLHERDDDRTIAHYRNVVAAPAVPAGLDWEEHGVSAATVERWIDGLAADGGRDPLAYYGLYPPAPVIPKIARRCLRWYPQYPGSATAAPHLPPWDGVSGAVDWSKFWFIWQWSASGRVAGVSTAVDMDRLACSRETFDAWYATGALPSVAADVVDGLVPSPLTLIRRPLRLNSTGPDVAFLQKALGVTDDGIFGPATRNQLLAFQRAHSLAADGIAGPATLGVLAAA